jgi:hypothetical protein
MATTCKKCGSQDFVFVEAEPKLSWMNYNILRCASCNSVVGLTDGISLEEIPSRRREVIISLLEKVNHLDPR